MLESGLSDARRLSCRARTRGARTTIAAAPQGAAALSVGSARSSGALPAQTAGESTTAHAAATHARTRLNRKVSGALLAALRRLAIGEAQEQGFGQLLC